MRTSLWVLGLWLWAVPALAQTVVLSAPRRQTGLADGVVYTDFDFDGDHATVEVLQVRASAVPGYLDFRVTTTTPTLCHGAWFTPMLVAQSHFGPTEGWGLGWVARAGLRHVYAVQTQFTVYWVAFDLPVCEGDPP